MAFHREERPGAGRLRPSNDHEVSPGGVDGQHVAVRKRIAQLQAATSGRHRDHQQSISQVEGQEGDPHRSSPLTHDVERERLRGCVAFRPPDRHDTVVGQDRERPKPLTTARCGSPRGWNQVPEARPRRHIVEVDPGPARIDDPQRVAPLLRRKPSGCKKGYRDNRLDHPASSDPGRPDPVS